MQAKNKAKVIWGAWSEWTYDEMRDAWCRVRRDDKGNYEYDYKKVVGGPRQAENDIMDQGISPTPSGSPVGYVDDSSIGGHIVEHSSESLEMDPRYCIQPSVRFQPGEIFKVYWSEPHGGVEATTGSSTSGESGIQNKFGARFFIGFRRFIVVANDFGHCTCVPILTYGGKACKKRGTKAEKHGVIYDQRNRPQLVSGEPKLGFPPVKAEMTAEGEKLSKESRVNYSKLVTVEHNVRVLFIGSICSSSWQDVEDAVNACWDQKIRRQRSRN